MDKELFAEAMLGRDAEDFLNTDIGRYLVGRAEHESIEAIEQLKKVYPWRRRKIQELQARIWRADSFQSWLAELIISGRQALQTIDDQERED